MNRLALLVLALAASTAAAVGNLYWNSLSALPIKTALERATIVKVTVLTRDKKTGEIKPEGFGSGVRVRENAILTCAHVARANTVIIEYIDGTHEVGRVAVRSKRDDLVVVSVAHPVGRIAKVGEDVTVGEVVIAIGHSMGIGWNTTLGIVGFIDEMVIVSDVVINGGNSGGGLFNQKMELVGIAQAILTPTVIKSYAGHSAFIPPYKIKAILKKYDRLNREGRLGQEIETGNVR